MNPDYRAMCSHPLAQEAYVAFVQLCKGGSDDAGTYDADEEIVRRALKRLDELESALLAEAPAEGPSDPISELVSQCRPLEPEMAECLTPQARWQLYGDDAQPVAEGPTDEELWELYQGPGTFSPVEYARAVLARWGRPAAAPLPESEAEGAPLSLVTNCHISGPAPKPFTHWSDYFNHVQQSGVISGLKIEATPPTPEATND